MGLVHHLSFQLLNCLKIQIKLNLTWRWLEWKQFGFCSCILRPSPVTNCLERRLVASSPSAKSAAKYLKFVSKHLNDCLTYIPICEEYSSDSFFKELLDIVRLECQSKCVQPKRQRSQCFLRRYLKQESIRLRETWQVQTNKCFRVLRWNYRHCSSEKTISFHHLSG